MNQWVCNKCGAGPALNQDGTLRLGKNGKPYCAKKCWSQGQPQQQGYQQSGGDFMKRKHPEEQDDIRWAQCFNGAIERANTISMKDFKSYEHYASDVYKLSCALYAQIVRKPRLTSEMQRGAGGYSQQGQNLSPQQQAEDHHNFPHHPQSNVPLGPSSGKSLNNPPPPNDDQAGYQQGVAVNPTDEPW